MTQEQLDLLRRLADAAQYGVPYYTAEDEAEDMAELLRLNYVDGDHTEVELTEFGYDQL